MSYYRRFRPFRNLCGGGWTRTTELRRGQIYSLLQLPLCDSPLFYEPIDGLEPPTGWLQISCSTNWAISAWDCVCLSNNVPRFWGCKNTLFSYTARPLWNFFSNNFKTLIWNHLILQNHFYRKHFVIGIPLHPIQFRNIFWISGKRSRQKAKPFP